MQNTDDFSKHIHTTSQAVDKVWWCCNELNHRVNYRILTTFHGAILLVLSFLTTTLIQRGIDDGMFDLTQLSVIMVLVLVTVFFDYLKEKFLDKYKKAEQFAHTGIHTGRPHKGYAHSFYQK